MKHSLSHEEKDRLDRLIAETEKRTGSQVVLAVIERSDSYAELPWKAFALGASLAGLLAFSMNILSPLNSPMKASMLAIIMMLSAGGGLALLSVFIPDFARLFLQDHRALMETRQYAGSLFLSRELFATKKRNAVLIMISIFERRVVILPDTGLALRLSQESMDEMTRHMSTELRAGRLAHAFEAALQKFEELMAVTVPQTTAGDELPNVIIEEKGE